VDQVLENSQEDRLHISIIPYATQVSLPETFTQYLNLSGEHDYSRCVNFSASDFNDIAVSTTAELEQTMHFDPWNNYDGRDDQPAPNLVPSPVCEADPTREMILFQNDAKTLKDYIEALTAGGNTSIDIGVKWGAALLDSSLNTVIRSMVDDAEIPLVFADRPKPYTDEDTMKVIVLMTDGQNTAQYYIEDEHRRGLSEVWWNERDQVYSMMDDRGTSDPGDDRFWFRDANSNIRRPDNTDYGSREAYSTQTGWNRRPYGCDGNNNPASWDCTGSSTGGGTVRLTYADLWAWTSVRANVERNYYPWWNDSTADSVWRWGVYDSVNGGTKDDRTKDICDAIKSQEAIVFAIGFEAPTSGQDVLKDCASSAAHYFDVDGLEIADAFTAIAHEITQLRLTQ
jgi:hypothetical protein